MAQAQDVLLVADVVTVDEGQPRAGALLLRDGRFMAVGAEAELRRRSPEATVEFLVGTFVPGFVDPHHHFLLGALAAHSPRLSAVGNVVDLLHQVRRLAAEVPADSAWVRLNGYDPRLLAERRAPHREDLDAVCPDRPLILLSYSWHEAVLNSAGWRAMGWTGRMRDDAQSRYVRDFRGRLTGEVRELPAYLAEAASRTPLSRLTAERWLAGAEVHGHRLLKEGIVRVADAAVPPEFDQLYLRAADEEALPVVVHRMAVAADALCRPRGLLEGLLPGPPQTPAGALKLILDGGDECAMCLTTRQVAQGAAAVLRAVVRGDGRAALRAGLRAGRMRRSHRGWQRGVRFWQPDALGAYVRRAAERGLPVAMHAIGNQAVSDALDALETALPQLRDLSTPSRLEHAMFLDARSQRRLADSGAHAVVQPAFLRELGQELGALPLPRDLQLMPFRGLLDHGVPVALSSDFPVATYEPLTGMRAAVSRQAAEGRVLSPEQALTPAQALHGYTQAGADALGVGQETGSIAPGKRADLVLLSHDPATEDGLSRARVVRTWSAGREVAASASARLIADRRPR